MYVLWTKLPGKGDIMAQSAALLGFLAVVLVLLIVICVVMFIRYKRAGQWSQAQESKGRTEPAVGTDKGPQSGPQQIHYHDTNSPMDEDIGGNVARVPRNNTGNRDNSRK
jgi:hypothetical protein